MNTDYISLIQTIRIDLLITIPNSPYKNDYHRFTSVLSVYNGLAEDSKGKYGIAMSSIDGFG